MKTKTRKIVAGVLIVLTVLHLPLYLIATEQEAKVTAFKMAYYLANKFGLTVRNNYNYGYLKKGESQYISTTLYRGNTYYLVAGGCSDAYDVDLQLYDENFNLIDKDKNSNKVALVAVSPKWTGTFYIKVKMYNCASGGAHWVLVYAYK